MSDFILNRARSIMALMQPATGDRASGPVTLFAPPTKVTNVPRGIYAFPVLGGQVMQQMLCKVDKNPATEDGSWDVTDAGTDVTFISNVGGDKFNLPAGTKMRIDPPIIDLVPDTAVVAAAGFTGGLDSSGFGAVKEVAMSEAMDGPVLSTDLRRTPGVTRFPAVVVSWDDAIPSDGSTQVQASRGSARLGTRVLLFASSYRISIISSRQDSDHARRHEGLFIAGNLARLISDRHSVDGECFSSPSPLQIRNIFRDSALPQDIYQKYYVYNILATTYVTLTTIDNRTYADWLLATLNVLKPQDPALPNQGDLPLVVDNEIDLSAP